MESIKVAMASHGKLSLRELNLNHGGNNVRWLNDREGRLLQTSLNSLEKAHKRTLSRLQNEVKGLHHTLREQVTIRSPQLTKETHLADKEDSETKRPATAMHRVTFDLQGEILAPGKTDEGTRGLATEEFEESTLEYITLEDASHLSQKTERGLGKTNIQREGAWTRKVSAALKRPLAKQSSNSSDHSSSSTTALSVPRRKISVTDPPSTKELSPRMRRTPSQNSLQVSASTTLNRSKTRSTEMINIASTHPNGSSALNDPLSPSLRKVSADSMSHVGSPIFFRRKISHHHTPRQSSPLRVVRKISCPPQIQHLPRVHQEEVIPLQLSRDNSGITSRPTATTATDLPKLDVSHGVEQGSPFDGNVSPLGLHVDGLDCTLQEKVNNFLRSLERNDDTYEHEDKNPE